MLAIWMKHSNVGFRVIRSDAVKYCYVYAIYEVFKHNIYLF